MKPRKVITKCETLLFRCREGANCLYNEGRFIERQRNKLYVCYYENAASNLTNENSNTITKMQLLFVWHILLRYHKRWYIFTNQLKNLSFDSHSFPSINLLIWTTSCCNKHTQLYLAQRAPCGLHLSFSQSQKYTYVYNSI